MIRVDTAAFFARLYLCMFRTFFKSANTCINLYKLLCPNNRYKADIYYNINIWSEHGKIKNSFT